MLCLRCGHYERGERIGAWFWPLLWNRATYPARHVFFSANLASLDAGCIGDAVLVGKDENRE
jgi:hypothetical protein